MEWVHIRTTRQYKLSFCIVSQAAFNCLQAKRQLPCIPLHSAFQPDRGWMAEWVGDPLSLSSGQGCVFSSESVQPSSQDDILQAGAEMEFTSVTFPPLPITRSISPLVQPTTSDVYFGSPSLPDSPSNSGFCICRESSDSGTARGWIFMLTPQLCSGQEMLTVEARQGLHTWPARTRSFFRVH